MPDETLEARVTAVGGSWDAWRPTGMGVVRLDATEVVLTTGETTMAVPYAALTGAAWRRGHLALHGAGGTLTIESDRALDRLWASLVQRACPVPEFTRGLRTLGSRRSVAHADEARFFAPLLQSRRLMEAEGELERRLATFPASVMRERLEHLLATLAGEAHPESAPERRALEAELLEASEPLLARLDDVAVAAGRFTRAPEAQRFDAWRAWVAEVAGVFAEADRSWARIVQVLPSPPASVPRRRWWSGRQ